MAFTPETSAATGADGRFQVENVRAGRGTLSVLRAGATSAM